MAMKAARYFCHRRCFAFDRTTLDLKFEVFYDDLQVVSFEDTKCVLQPGKGKLVNQFSLLIGL